MNVRALGRKKPRLFALKVHAGFGKRDSGNGAHLRVNPQQQIEILLHRRSERINLEWCRPLRHRRGFGSQSNVFLLHTRRGFRNFNRSRGRRFHRARPKSADAANPHAPPAITRTPTPSDSDSEACPTRPFLVVSERLRIDTTRASAYVTPRTDAAARAWWAADFIADLTYHESCSGLYAAN